MDGLEFVERPAGFKVFQVPQPDPLIGANGRQQATARAKRHADDFAVVRSQLVAGLPARFRVAEPESPVAGRGDEEPAVGRAEGDAKDPDRIGVLGVPLKGAQVSVFEVPKCDRVVRTRAGEELPVRTEREVEVGADAPGDQGF